MGEQYIVEAILDERSSKGKKQYKVKWKGYSMQECTWQPQENLADCRGLIKAYNQGQSKATSVGKGTKMVIDDEEQQQANEKRVKKNTRTSKRLRRRIPEESYQNLQESENESEEQKSISRQQQQNVRVLSIFKGVNTNKISFNVQVGDEVVRLNRKQLIKTNIYALIQFYEKNIDFETK